MGCCRSDSSFTKIYDHLGSCIGLISTHQVLSLYFEAEISRPATEEVATMAIRIYAYSVRFFEVIHYEGTEQKRSLEEPALGGMRIHLFDQNKNIIAALWLRGSKTEPVFRLMVDCKAPYDQDITYWHSLHRGLILQADHLA